MSIIIKTLFFVCIPVISFSQTAQEFFTQGKIDYNNARYAEAIDNFTKAINLDSADINFFLQRGFSYGMIKNFNAAIIDFTKVISMDDKHRWAYVSRGSARNKTGEFQIAMDDFNKALSLDPTDQEAYNNRGFSKKAMGDFKGACEDWHRSKKMGNEEAKIILKNNRCK